MERTGEDPEKLLKLRDMPGVVLNVDKQRNGDWTGRINLDFDISSYQYRTRGDSGKIYVKSNKEMTS